MPIGSSVLTSIVHPLIPETLGPVFPSLCTIQEVVETQAANGEIVRTWTDREDVKAVACIFATAAHDETRLADYTSVRLDQVCDLVGFYPQIQVGDRAQIVFANQSPTAWNITGVKFDSQSEYTRLEVEQFST